MNKTKKIIKKRMFGTILVITMLICSFGFAFNSKNFVVFAGEVDDVEYSITQIINGQTPNDNYITINSAEEFIAFSNEINQGHYNSYSYKLTTNIELNENSSNYSNWKNNPPANTWTPIGSVDCTFDGIFDGQGYTISGVYINNTDDYQGLFGFNNGLIINVNTINYFINGGSKVGGLVGENNGSVINCLTGGLVRSSSHNEWDSLGGIVGVNEAGGLIMNCCNLKSVTGSGTIGTYCIGGIVGISYGSVINCYNAGGIMGGADHKGSIGFFDDSEGGESKYNYWLEMTCGVYGGNCEQGITDSFDGNGNMQTSNNNSMLNEEFDISFSFIDSRLVDTLNCYVSNYNILYANEISFWELKQWVSGPFSTLAANKTIEFNEDGGEYLIGYTKPSIYLEGTEVDLPTAEHISKVGYTFNGWTQYETEWNEITNPYITSISATDFGNKTFYAKWSINQYTYTFYDEDGNTIIKTETIDYGTQIVEPIDPEKPDFEGYHYTFDGWYTEQTGGTKVETFGNIDENGATYYARYLSTEIINDSFAWIWILIGGLGVGLVAVCSWLFLYKRKAKFINEK